MPLIGRLTVATNAARIASLHTELRMRTKWKRLLVTVLVVAGVVLFGPSQKIEHYSCHNCRSLKDVSVVSFFGIPGRPKETLQLSNQITERHVHDWWEYSVYKQSGLFGSLSKRVACKPTQFKDGQGRVER